MPARLNVVHQTWDDLPERNERFPKLIEFRRKWKEMGFSVDITATEDLRNDVIELQGRFPENNILSKFDALPSQVMKYDMWRYVKIYLEGGVYADVDVEPLDVSPWTEKALDTSQAVLFEESSWSNTTLNRVLIPSLSDYQQIPSIANCFFIAPPNHPFFLELIDAISVREWEHAPNPKRTLMTTGPGLVTEHSTMQGVRTDLLLVSFEDRRLTYVHHGFGTWKTWVPREIVWILLLCSLLGLYWWKFVKRKPLDCLLPNHFVRKTVLTSHME